MNFKSWNQHRLRRLLEYVQARVLEMRQQQHFSSQFSAAAAAQFAKAYAAQTQAQMSGQQLDAPDTLALLEQPSAAHVLPATSQPKESPATPSPTEPRLASVAARISHGRSALGTYTRNKLPSFRRLSLPGSTGASETRPTPESGEVFQEGYRPAPNAVNGIGRFGIRYDFES